MCWLRLQSAPWPTDPRCGFPLVWLAIVLTIIGLALIAAAVVLFRREGTELNPTSTTNSALITAGPYRLTRNPMYLGLVMIALGIALG
jgi:protein-S-isoprenylcysteine O-methyltransferase Ste14